MEQEEKCWVYFYQTTLGDKGACIGYEYLPKNTDMCTIKELTIKELEEVLIDGNINKYF